MNKIIVWGTDDYTVKKEYVSFVRCNSEMHMLDEFLKF